MTVEGFALHLLYITPSTPETATSNASPTTPNPSPTRSSGPPPAPEAPPPTSPTSATTPADSSPPAKAPPAATSTPTHSVGALTNESGNLTQSYTYDPYGGTTQTTAAGAINNPWRFTGAYHDTTQSMYKSSTGSRQ